MFLFVVCQNGAEGAVKKEISRGYPHLKFAYSRPGFITFKNSDPSKPLTPDFELSSIFARAYGLSIGKAARPDEAFSAAEKLLQQHASPECRLRLHVWDRDAHTVGEEPRDFVAGRVASDALSEIRRSPRFKDLFLEGERAELNDLVLDLIHLDPDSWWLGYHQHTPQHSPFPGGRPPIELPAEAPSRAYLKLEEARLWSGAPLQKGDTAIEIGSAPGGASYALLEHGLTVIGVDPGEMDPAVRKLGGARFKHLAKPAAQVKRSELPAAVQWILLDMNVAPVVALNTVERIVPWYADSLLGVILTLKLNEWKFADEIPKLLRRVQKLGMVRIRARQLANNKQEICVVGLNRKALARGRK